jgi:cytochrome c-type biogenesis protein CcmE
MTGSTKLTLACLVVAATTAYMAYLGAAESWQYYLTCDECLADLDGFAGKRVRVSGKLAEGTLQHSRGSGQVSFDLRGTDRVLGVVCTGTVPDNLAEGIEVVVEGRLDSSRTLRGDKLLTKCAGKYASQGSAESDSGLEDEKEVRR